MIWRSHDNDGSLLCDHICVLPSSKKNNRKTENMYKKYSGALWSIKKKIINYLNLSGSWIAFPIKIINMFDVSIF